MNTLVNIFLNRYRISCLFIFLLMAIFSAENAFAVPQPATDKGTQPEKQTLSISVPVNTDTFEYEIEDRPDPFVPFLTEKLPQFDPNEIIDTNQQLSGMQLFEPGQLTLVALIETKGEYLAMVEDTNNKGYIIEKGIKIGSRGVVQNIVPNKVIIEETATTRSGKKLTTKIVMVLKKEGEK